MELNRGNRPHARISDAVMTEQRSCAEYSAHAYVNRVQVDTAKNLTRRRLEGCLKHLHCTRK